MFTNKVSNICNYHFFDKITRDKQGKLNQCVHKLNNQQESNIYLNHTNKVNKPKIYVKQYQGSRFVYKNKKVKLSIFLLTQYLMNYSKQ